jgi:hypothetical protein
LNNKYYTIFFASDENQYSRSFRLSKKGLIVFLFFGIALLIVSISSIIFFINKDLYPFSSKILEKDRVLLHSIINDLEYFNELDSLSTYEVYLRSFYSYHNIKIPNSPPVEGYVSRGLQLNNNHLGIDIAAKKYDEVKAPADGRVIFCGTDEALGKTIILSHFGGFTTLYGHNDTLLVKQGDEVLLNQVISLVGETGNSQGPHLHFEVWKNNKIIDPREIVSIYKEKDVSIR